MSTRYFTRGFLFSFRICLFLVILYSANNTLSRDIQLYEPLLVECCFASKNSFIKVQSSYAVIDPFVFREADIIAKPRLQLVGAPINRKMKAFFEVCLCCFYNKHIKNSFKLIQ